MLLVGIAGEGAGGKIISFLAWDLKYNLDGIPFGGRMYLIGQDRNETRMGGT